jgi:hypothetical protein
MTTAASLANIACGAGEGEVETTARTEDEKRIEPVDGETLGFLRVDAPPGWLLPPVPSNDATVTFNAPGRPAPADIPFGRNTRLNPAKGCIQVRSKFQQPTVACEIAVERGFSTTYTIASIEARYDGSTSGPLTVDFGPRPRLSIFQRPEGSPTAPETQVFSFAGIPTNDAFWNGKPQRAVLAAPGDYRFSWNLPILEDVRKTVVEEERAVIPLASLDRRATVVVKPPVRELPDAPFAACQGVSRTFLVHRARDNAALSLGEPAPGDLRVYNGNVAAYPEGYLTTLSQNEGLRAYRALRVNVETSIRVFPFAASEAPSHYELVVNGVPQLLDVRPGETTAVQLERLDVDDIEITREDGVTYAARGTYQVYRRQADGSWKSLQRREGQSSDCSGTPRLVDATFPTNTGIDVLPGTYRLIIKYATGEGPREQDLTVTVP